jgi:hypothetical protein
MYLAKMFQTPGEMLDFLNDVLIGTQPITGPLNVNGLTLIINATTVTLVGTKTLNQIVAAVNTAMSGQFAEIRNYGRTPPYGSFLAIAKATAVVDKDGTANALFGLPTAADYTVGAAAIVKAKLIDMEIDHTGRIFHILYEA